MRSEPFATAFLIAPVIRACRSFSGARLGTQHLKRTFDRMTETETGEAAAAPNRGRMMPLRSKLAALLYAMDGVISVGLGAVYLFRGSFMPYHAEALSRSWEDVEPALQVLLGALMDVAGAGWIALGVATLVLVALPVRRGEQWARVLVPTLLLLFYIPTLLATLAVLRETPGSPPWYGNAVACLIAVAAFLLDAPWRRQAQS